MPTDDPSLEPLGPARPERKHLTSQLEPSRFALFCLAIYAGCWLFAAAEPYHRRDWLLENLLAFIAVPYLVFQQWKRPFRPGTNALLLIFLCLHAVGAHFTYAEVPYDAWAQKLTGQTVSDLLHWDRNHFDRLVHFAYGVLVVPAAKELYARHLAASELMLNLIAIQFIVATSAAYELIEWGAVLVVDQDLGMAYLGIQGDVWDAQKDVLLASVGAIASAVGISVRRVTAAQTGPSA
jgi:putative membrane protein